MLSHCFLNDLSVLESQDLHQNLRLTINEYNVNKKKNNKKVTFVHKIHYPLLLLFPPNGDNKNQNFAL